MDRKIALRISVKAMNDTMGPNGSLPSYLVLGCVPRFPGEGLQTTLTSVSYGCTATRSSKMATIFAEMHIQKALASRVPRNADLTKEPGDKVQIYHESDRTMLDSIPSSELMKSTYSLLLMTEKYNSASTKSYKQQPMTK